MEPEPIWKASDDNEPTQVPVSGQIEFRNVVVRYKPEAPIVLKNLSFKIESGQKIGVVGRTGAGKLFGSNKIVNFYVLGKTTITSALFRLVELEEGEVLVGDVNIKRMGSKLRHHLTIIPQVSIYTFKNDSILCFRTQFCLPGLCARTWIRLISSAVNNCSRSLSGLDFCSAFNS